MTHYVFAYASLHDNVLHFETVEAENERDALIAGMAKIDCVMDGDTAEDIKAAAFDADMIVGATAITPLPA